MILGLFVASILKVAACLLFYSNYHTGGDFNLSTSSIIIGVFGFGLLIPLLSNIGPTQLAMSKSLRTSLDQTR